MGIFLVIGSKEIELKQKENEPAYNDKVLELMEKGKWVAVFEYRNGDIKVFEENK